MKIVMIIAKQGFRDEEFKVPSDYFIKNDIDVDIASTEKGECIGKFGLKAEANLAFDNVNIDDYDAIVLVGGPGSHKLVGNKELENILYKAKNKDILIGAICYSPVIIAKAGLLKGKKATVWDDDKKQSQILEQEGAKYVNEETIIDGNIITANGPEAASSYAEEIVKALR